MMRRPDKPIYLNGTHIGIICFTRFGFRAIADTGYTFSHSFRDEEAAVAALVSTAVQSADGSVIGFIYGPAPFSAYSLTGLRVGDFETTEEAVASVLRWIEQQESAA